ncbi:hypothetical protein COY93_03510, partial [Candidatus Uhrbacteria bacterium CG_4_10_14_0_8_um_filter_58_22]
MAQAKRDSNQVPTLIAVSNADGITPVVLYADPTTHRLLVSATSALSGATTALDNLASVAINTDLIGAVTSGMGIRGGSTANDDLILEGTTHATKTSSYVII